MSVDAVYVKPRYMVCLDAKVIIIWAVVIILSSSCLSLCFPMTHSLVSGRIFPFPCDHGDGNKFNVSPFVLPPPPLKLEFIFCPDSPASHGRYPMCVLLLPDWELAPELPCATQWPGLSSVNTVLLFSAYTLHPHVFQEFYFCLSISKSLPETQRDLIRSKVTFLSKCG